jgi:arylsulfatase A-like enzyme
VYAAMVEAMDYHIGRLIAYLEETDQYKKTIFIFASDNGSEASGLANQNTSLNQRVLRAQNYNVDYATLGLKGSFNAISPSFASASASPLAYYKFYVGEGGMRVPLIIAGDSIPLKNELSNAFSFVTDITPTILALTQTTKPAERYGGRKVEAIMGRNLLPLLNGHTERVYAEQDSVGYELGGHAALFQGDFKISLNRAPLGNNEWRLYNIVTDPGESKDLSSMMPARLQNMLGLYHQFTIDNKVLPVAANYYAQRQVALNGLQQRFGSQILLMILTVLVVLPFYLVYRLSRK